MSDKLRAKTLDAYSKVLERDIGAVQGRCRELQKELEKSNQVTDLFASLSSVISSQPPIAMVKPLKKRKDRASGTKETAVLMISDMHADQVIPDHRVQGLENFDFNVACHRGHRLVSSTLSLLRENFVTHNFDRLVVLLMGDLTTGEIHGATGSTHFNNTLKNAMAIGELLGHMLSDLAEEFPVDVVCVSGNHGRRSKKKDYRGPHNNYDYLIAKWAEAKCAKYVEADRMSFSIPDSFTACVNIRDWNFIVNHGDDIRGVAGIPWYGMERRTRRMTAIGALTGHLPNYFLYGHFHTHTSQQHTTGETLVNGSWPATDEYALESLGAASEPSQWLMGVHDHYGVTWRVPMYLRIQDWKVKERDTPHYNIIV